MKRFTALLLTGILSCTAATASFAAVTDNAAPWAKASLEYAYNEGLLTAEELQNIKTPMKRAEFCKLILRFLEAATGEERKATKKSPFRDCSDPAVLAVYEAGIVGGVEDGIFAPERTMTREQMTIILVRTLEVCGIDLSAKAKAIPFEDTKRLYDTSKQYISELYGANILKGYENNTFRPHHQMTVQEAAVAFTQAYKYMIETTKPAKPEKVEEPEAPKQEAAKPEQPETPKQETQNAPTATIMKKEVVTVGGKEVSLGMTLKQLKEVWGEPDRVDKTLYGLERYVYINGYVDYFFATVQDEAVVEIFVPGTDYEYQGVKGKGISADIENLSYISSADHSGVIKHDTAEIRFPLDYEGQLCGIWLQTKDFVTEKNPVSMLEYHLKVDMEEELLDLIQVRRLEAGQPILTADKKLTDVARKHSEDMAKNLYLAYNDLEGKTPFNRIMERGKTFLTASEIIAKQRGDVVNIYQEWVRTAVRINGLTDTSMQEVGVGVDSRMKELYVTVDLCGQGELKK